MENRIGRYFVFGLFAAALGLLPATKALSETLQGPQQVIQDVSDTLQKQLQDKAFTQDFAQVTRFVNGVIGPHTDFDKIAPLVLGKHWNTASLTEKERFKTEFQTLLVRAYARAFIEYNDWTIQYLPLDMASNASKVLVKTKILQRSLQPIEVNYRMFLSKSNWKVYDILLDGVSLVTNYRSSFSEDIQRRGSLGLVIDNLARRNTEALAVKGQVN
jgi:phospholipid transport system substrate-binding protein